MANEEQVEILKKGVTFYKRRLLSRVFTLRPGRCNRAAPYLSLAPQLSPETEETLWADSVDSGRSSSVGKLTSVHVPMVGNALETKSVRPKDRRPAGGYVGAGPVEGILVERLEEHQRFFPRLTARREYVREGRVT